MNVLDSQRHLFDIPREIAYFNCAYISPLTNRAVDAGIAGLQRKARPWNIGPEAFFDETEDARAVFAELIGAHNNDIALVPAASYGLAVATANLPVKAGQSIVLQAEEYHSSVLSWRNAVRCTGGRIVVVERPICGNWTAAICDAIDEQTAVVHVCPTHWVCGGIVDLVEVSRRCKVVGAALVVDATQSCGAQQLDVKECDPDFIVVAAYKWLLGPYSSGFLYVAPRHHEGIPLEQGWATRRYADDFRLLEYYEQFQPGARRFDVGERSNFALLPATIAALRQILEWRVDRVEATIGEVTAVLAVAMQQMGALVISDAYRARHYLSVRFPQGFPENLASRLAAEGVYVSVRGDWLRLTPHVYNDEPDINKLIFNLTAALK